MKSFLDINENLVMPYWISRSKEILFRALNTHFCKIRDGGDAPRMNILANISFDHKINLTVITDRCNKWSFGKINLFVLKYFYSLKHKRDITQFLKTSRGTFFLKF